MHYNATIFCTSNCTAIQTAKRPTYSPTNQPTLTILYTSVALYCTSARFCKFQHDELIASDIPIAAIMQADDRAPNIPVHWPAFPKFIRNSEKTAEARKPEASKMLVSSAACLDPPSSNATMP